MINTRWLLPALLTFAAASSAFVSRSTSPHADTLACDLTRYTARSGLTATVSQDALVVSWTGQGGTDLRARYGIDAGRPIVRDLAIRKASGPWVILGQNLTPEYHVTSGIRRMTAQQAQPLRQLGVEITQDVIDRNRWYAFWDSPLVVPGTPPPSAGRGGQPAQSATGDIPIGRGERVYGLPRKAEEIRRASASFTTHRAR